MTLAQRIVSTLSGDYSPREYPALDYQLRTWAASRPLDGLSIVDATPMFRNTCLKYAALIAAGARLTAAVSSALPHDPNVPALLHSWGIPVAEAAHLSTPFDLVLDCAASLSHLPARRGYVELTKSGEGAYAHTTSPVYLVDQSRIKRIETCLGTGESFLRALQAAGYQNLAGKSLLVAGYGKVGRGIALYALRAGMKLTIADIEPKPLPDPRVRFVNVRDQKAFDAALLNANYAVSATGVKHALHGLFDAERLVESPTILANMGVEDEWGPGIPPQRILNHNHPANFALKDPTLMCYIDPPMALHNACAALLAAPEAPIPGGLNPPPAGTEAFYLDLIRRSGSIPDNLLNSL